MNNCGGRVDPGGFTLFAGTQKSLFTPLFTKLAAAPFGPNPSILPTRCTCSPRTPMLPAPSPSPSRNPLTCFSFPRVTSLNAQVCSWPVLAQLQDRRASPESARETSMVQWLGELTRLKQGPGATPHGGLQTAGRTRW